MKAFRFRGARILEWRRVQADAARVAFVRAAESVREAVREIEAANAEADRAERELVAALASPAEVGTFQRYRNWIDRQRQRAAEWRRTHDERQAIADRAAAALQEAQRNVRMMERLRDRLGARHLENERQVEMKDLDQLATLQHARRIAEGGTTDHGH